MKRNPILKKRKRIKNPKTDYFEQLPDEVLLHIIDLVRHNDEIKAVFRLRALSHRFNSFITLKTKYLFLQADKFDKIFDTDLGSYHSCYSSQLASETMLRTTNYPNRDVFLGCCFSYVTKLVIELPVVDAKHMKPSHKHEVSFMYKATFGQNLKSWVVLSYLNEGYSDIETDFLRWLVHREKKTMYVSVQKYACSMARKVVPHLQNLVMLVVRDGQEDLEMVMDEKGTRECREKTYDARIVMPMRTAKVRCRMRTNRDGCIDIGGGLGQGVMVLGVVLGPHYEKFDDAEEANLVRRAFGSGVHGLAIENLLRNSFYIESTIPCVSLEIPV